jgi:hypothetical protein
VAASSTSIENAATLTDKKLVGVTSHPNLKSSLILDDSDSDDGEARSNMSNHRSSPTLSRKETSTPNSEISRNTVKMQSILYKLQKIIEEHDGILRQFIIDDKGCVLIACFGCSGTTAMNIALSASLAAIKIRSLSPGVYVGVGITTGLVFCGCVGNQDRREFAVIGSNVNLSARLMSESTKRAEKENGSIIVDENSFKEIDDSINTVAIAPLKLKGIKNEVVCYQIINEKNIAKTHGHRNSFVIENGNILSEDSNLVGSKIKVGNYVIYSLNHNL